MRNPYTAVVVCAFLALGAIMRFRYGAGQPFGNHEGLTLSTVLSFAVAAVIDREP